MPGLPDGASPAWQELLGPRGRELVDLLCPWEPESALARIATIRANPAWAGDPDLVAAAATQAELRTRARVRFPGPARWWTRTTLEQATRPVLAARHAARIVAAGCGRVVDLGCGAGSDSLAMAAAGLEVLAVDRDPDALVALAATAADLGLPVRTRLADVRDVVVELTPDPGTALFVDPARREHGGGRRMHPESWSPPWSWVLDLAGTHRVVGAKVAPGIPHAVIPRVAEAQWSSVGGDLLEAAIWWDGEPPAAHRRALVHPQSGGPAAELTDAAGIPGARVGQPGQWLVEPDPAVIRAGLVSLLADHLRGWLLDPQIAYISGSGVPPQTPMGASFTVRDQVPFARKPMRRWLVEHGFGNVVIKKRGLDLDPVELRRSLRLDGDGPTATLVLARTDSGPLALSVERA